MALIVTRTQVWTAILKDRAGGLAETLEPLVREGASFEFLLARRMPERPGKGIVFAAPINGARLIKAARTAGFATNARIHALRIEGPDKAGLMAEVCRTLADAGINFRGLSAAGIGRKFAAYLALDSAEDVRRAAAALKKIR